MAELIRTGAAASILGTSRQHVVDLCARGVLQSHGAGVHRRLARRDVLALMDNPRTRDQRKSLWLHAAVAGRVAKDPRAALERARANIARIRLAHGPASPWLDRWEQVVASGPEEVIRLLASDTPEANELRQNSPFAGLLTEHERARVLAAFRSVDRTRDG